MAYLVSDIVSVIVSTKNSAQTLRACLLSIKNQSYPYIELIVVDNFSDDMTMHIAKCYADATFQIWPERSAQRNYGVSHSHGIYVLIIDSDMILDVDVVKNCVDTIHTSQTIQWIIIPEESFGNWFWSQCKKLERSLYIWVERLEAARFFTRAIFEKVWWYDISMIAWEDRDLSQKVSMYHPLWRINSYIYHNEWALNLLRTCQKKFYYGQHIYYYKIHMYNTSHFQNQSNIMKRFWLFFSQPKKLFNNPIVGLWMLYMKTMEMISASLWYFIGTFKKVNNIY
jgi:glycosyltransferase involved in cell wall biosynthesis